MPLKFIYLPLFLLCWSAVVLQISWSLLPPSLPPSQGLLEMLPMEYLTEFDSQEFEWVIAGTADIDMDDWKKNTLYWGGEDYEYH